MNTYVFGIDPGVKGCGISFFDPSGVLIRAWYQPTIGGPYPLDDLCWGRPVVVMIEKPQTYQGRAAVGDANDLIALAIRIGELAHEFCGYGATVKYVAPRGWKGNVPKPISHDRIRARLEKQGSLQRVELPKAKKLKLDVWDSIGVGLFAIKGKRW